MSLPAQSPVPSELPDGVLVALAQAGDSAALEVLFARYNTRICLYLVRMVGDDGIGCELAQETFAFDTNTVPVNTRVLDLHFNVLLVRTFIAGLTPPANGNVSLPQIGHTSFDFSVPFNTGRVINMHQTVTVHGVSLTLERVVVTRSEARISLFCPNSSLDIVQNFDNNTFHLSNGNQHVLMPRMSDLKGPVIVLQFHNPLNSEGGVWTLRFQVTTPKQDIGTLTFHFVVPA